MNTKKIRNIELGTYYPDPYKNYNKWLESAFNFLKDDKSQLVGMTDETNSKILNFKESDRLYTSFYNNYVGTMQIPKRFSFRHYVSFLYSVIDLMAINKFQLLILKHTTEFDRSSFQSHIAELDLEKIKNANKQFDTAFNFIDKDVHIYDIADSKTTLIIHMNSVLNIKTEEYDNLSNLIKLLNYYNDKTDDSRFINIITEAVNEFITSVSIHQFAIKEIMKIQEIYKKILI